jgi:hypothetical protein
MSTWRRLNRGEILQAAMVGIERRIDSRRRGINDKVSRNGSNGPTPWGREIESACAEKAVAKLLRLPWDTRLGRFHKPDVGPYGVRHTMVHTNGLLLRPGDPKEIPYILVTGHAPAFCIRGWLWGSEVMVSEWERASGPKFKDFPCWIAPQECLHDLSTLPKPEALPTDE